MVELGIVTGLVGAAGLLARIWRSPDVTPVRAEREPDWLVYLRSELEQR